MGQFGEKEDNKNNANKRKWRQIIWRKYVYSIRYAAGELTQLPGALARDNQAGECHPQMETTNLGTYISTIVGKEKDNKRNSRR